MKDFQIAGAIANLILKESGRRHRIAKFETHIVGGFKYLTTKGRSIAVLLSTTDGLGFSIRSIVLIKDSSKPARVLLNGQAGRNAQDLFNASSGHVRCEYSYQQALQWQLEILSDRSCPSGQRDKEAEIRVSRLLEGYPGHEFPAESLVQADLSDRFPRTVNELIEVDSLGIQG